MAAQSCLRCRVWRTHHAALTLVEVLAALAILALMIAVLAPLSARAAHTTASNARLIAARAALADCPLPTTTHGEQPMATLPDCRLRWSVTDTLVAGPTAGTNQPGRWLRLQILTLTDEGAAIVLAERDIPLLGALP